MTTILRFTRHSLFSTEELPEELKPQWEKAVESSNRDQIFYLKEKFGQDIRIVELWSKGHDFTAEEIVLLANIWYASVVEVVLPIEVTAKIIELAPQLKVVRANMKRVNAPLMANPKNCLFLFSSPDYQGCYEITKEIKIVKERL